MGYRPWGPKELDITETTEHIGIAFETSFRQSDEATLKTEFQGKLIILKIQPPDASFKYLNLLHVEHKEHLFSSEYYTASIYDSDSS